MGEVESSLRHPSPAGEHLREALWEAELAALEWNGNVGPWLLTRPTFLQSFQSRGPITRA
jgi:hypothetical protein